MEGGIKYEYSRDETILNVDRRQLCEGRIVEGETKFHGSQSNRKILYFLEKNKNTKCGMFFSANFSGKYSMGIIKKYSMIHHIGGHEQGGGR